MTTEITLLLLVSLGWAAIVLAAYRFPHPAAAPNPATEAVLDEVTRHTATRPHLTYRARRAARAVGGPTRAVRGPARDPLIEPSPPVPGLPAGTTLDAFIRDGLVDLRIHLIQAARHSPPGPRTGSGS